MRKIFAVLCALFCFPVFAGPMVNVDYIHKLIKQQHGIELKCNADNVYQAANMKYMLTSIDVVNEMLNGEQITHYGTSTYATLNATDTVATIDAVNDLVKYPKFPFSVKTTENTQTFDFSISAAGHFVIDWGDKNIEIINKRDTTVKPISHTYKVPGQYTIRFAGKATDYAHNNAYSSATNEYYSSSAISFQNNKNLSEIFGSIGQIFSTLENDKQPSFDHLFYLCSNLKSAIPTELFNGVYGQPIPYMFWGTFASSSVSEIPADLFVGMQGVPVKYLFWATFQAVVGTPFTIPETLFCRKNAAGEWTGIVGAPAKGMFRSLFGKSMASGNLPKYLFGGISGQVAEETFYFTFSDVLNLRGYIPSELFKNIEGYAYNAYHACFAGIENSTMDKTCPQGTTQVTMWPGQNNWNGIPVCAENE